MSEKQLFDENSTFERLTALNQSLIRNSQTLEYLQNFRKDSDVFYGKSMFELVSEKILEDRPKLKKNELKKEVVKILKEVNMDENNLKDVPASIYLKRCMVLTRFIGARRQEINILASLTGRTPDDLDAATGFRTDKAIAYCDFVPDTERILADRKKKRVMTFLGTPHTIAHKSQLTSRKAAEAFFSIGDFLTEKGLQL